MSTLTPRAVGMTGVCQFCDPYDRCQGTCHGVDLGGNKLDVCPYCQGKNMVQDDKGNIHPCPLGCTPVNPEGHCQTCVGDYCTAREGCVTLSNPVAQSAPALASTGGAK